MHMSLRTNRINPDSCSFEFFYQFYNGIAFSMSFYVIIVVI